MTRTALCGSLPERHGLRHHFLSPVASIGGPILVAIVRGLVGIKNDTRGALHMLADMEGSVW
ncbi:hypothetical protein [Primorskyibacter marinus]|uniref:hypothetical protein n=1 Tax=Primorskyibacter marinus TaxID=1977320 RepID=UPI000E30032A|nr:hypothetical protein [Primorskyibacter marinus]